MRKGLLAFAFFGLAGCVAPYGEHGPATRVASIEQVRLTPVNGDEGTYEIFVRATADGDGWLNAQLRILPSASEKSGELVVEMVAQAPYQAAGRNYDPSRAYAGDTYGTPGSQRWPSGTHAVDTYYGKGQTLEASLIVKLQSTDRSLRVVGVGTAFAAMFDTLLASDWDGTHSWSDYGHRRSSAPVVRITENGAAFAYWNGMPLGNIAALQDRLVQYATERRHGIVRLQPDNGVRYERLDDILSLIKRFGFGVRLGQDTDLGLARSLDRDREHLDERTKPLPPTGFWFPNY